MNQTSVSKIKTRLIHPIIKCIVYHRFLVAYVAFMFPFPVPFDHRPLSLIPTDNGPDKWTDGNCREQATEQRQYSGRGREELLCVIFVFKRLHFVSHTYNPHILTIKKEKTSSSSAETTSTYGSRIQKPEIQATLSCATPCQVFM